MRLRPCGDVGLLVELPDLASALALHAALEAAPPRGVVDLVPAARTVLLHLDPTVTTVGEVAAAVRGIDTAAAPARSSSVVEVPVVYDGADLDEVAQLTRLSREGVVDAHTAQTWTVAFVGFAPGFGYLVGETTQLHVPRRSTPRTRVPAGAVALAGEFTGVYPRSSPGGWQLLGRTELAMWQLERDPPALLQPGTQVRFVDVT